MRPTELAKWLETLNRLYDDGTITLAEFERIANGAFDHVQF